MAAVREHDMGGGDGATDERRAVPADSLFRAPMLAAMLMLEVRTETKTRRPTASVSRRCLGEACGWSSFSCRPWAIPPPIFRRPPRAAQASSRVCVGDRSDTCEASRREIGGCRCSPSGSCEARCCEFPSARHASAPHVVSAAVDPRRTAAQDLPKVRGVFSTTLPSHDSAFLVLAPSQASHGALRATPRVRGKRAPAATLGVV